MIQDKKNGFTIIELLLAMSFVAMLMVAIAVMVMQMSNIMVKGKTFKELNTAGRLINSDLTRNFNSLQSIDGWDGRSFVSGATPGASYVRNELGGAFCTGDFTYVWNSAAALNNGNGPAQYRGPTDNTIRFIRIKDVTKRYCQDSSADVWTEIPRDSSQVTEILPPGETDLMLYDIRFRQVGIDAATGQSMINIQYVLGTRGDSGIDVVNSQCRPNSDLANYCAINRFDLLVRTIGSK